MDKKDIKQKILEALRSNADIKTLDKKFDKVLKALSEKLTTQIITRVAPDIEVVNLEKEISRVVEELKNSNETFKQIIKTNQEVSELPRMVEIKNFKEFKQDNSSIVTALSSFFSGMVEFFTKLARTNTYKVMPDEKCFTTPQMVIVVDPRTMKPVSPKDFGGEPANIHVSTGSASGGGSGGGTASEVKLKDSGGNIIDPATETTLALISGDLGDTADAEATGDGTLIAISKRIRTLLGTMNGYLDGVEGSLNTLVSQTDTIEAGIGQTTDAQTTGNGSLIAILKQNRTYLSNIDTDLGASTDSEATGNGSVIAILKRIRTLLSSTISISGTVSGTVYSALSSDGGASGGLTSAHYTLQEAPVNLVDTRCIVYGFQVSNPSTDEDVWLQIHDLISPSIGTNNPKQSIFVPMRTTVVVPYVTPIFFSNAFTCAATNTPTGATGITTEISVNVQYMETA